MWFWAVISWTPGLGKWFWSILGGLAVIFLMWLPTLGMFLQPWGPWWFTSPGASGITAGAEGEIPFAPPPPVAGFLSDADRYHFSRAVGWGAEDAIVATAISIAENGSGNPSAQSGVNHNGSIDFGLWQINSVWWAQFGGREALANPLRNAQAAYYIKSRQGWCAWSTYGPGCQYHGCGPPCYLSFLDRARAASLVQPLPGQA